MKEQIKCQSTDIDVIHIQHEALMLEIVVLNLALERQRNDEANRLLTSCAADAFSLFCALPQHRNSTITDGIRLLKTCLLGILGDKKDDVSRFLSCNWHELPLLSQNWAERTWATVIDAWLWIVRKNQADYKIVLANIAALRKAQLEYEKDYLDDKSDIEAQKSAFELICLYHLAKSAEIYAEIYIDSTVDINQKHKSLEFHFNQICSLCRTININMVEIEVLTYLLFAACIGREYAHN